MTLQDAAQLLIADPTARIRRVDWEPDEFIAVDDGLLYRQYGHDHLFHFTRNVEIVLGDFQAEWERYRQP